MTDDQDKPVEIPLVPPRRHASLRIVRLLIVIVAVLAATALAVWSARMALNSASRKSTRTNISLITLALRVYSEDHGHLPYPVVTLETGSWSRQAGPPKATGRPLYSWRVEIIPDLMNWHGTWDPSRSWDDPINRQLVELSSVYAYDATGPDGYPQSFPETNILAITGPGTAFGDGTERPMALKDVPPQTILAVETRASGIPWPAPGDFVIRSMPQTVNAPNGKGISSRNAGGFHVVFADTRVWLLSDKVPFESLKKFFTMADAHKHDREKLLGPFVLHGGL